jgi:hypothetical protein
MSSSAKVQKVQVRVQSHYQWNAIMPPAPDVGLTIQLSMELTNFFFRVLAIMANHWLAVVWPSDMA